MFRFIIMMFLIDSFYRSLGNPIVTVQPLANSLKDLANRCGSRLLVSQIEDRLQDCNVAVPPFNGKQMQCLIFYDMNNQLCEAISNSKLVLQDNFVNDLHKTITVDLLCNNSETWKFSNSSAFPLYKITAETVFRNHVQCQKVCDVPDLLSEDSNIFCKYYKWGSEIINAQTSTPSMHDKSTKPAVNAVDHNGAVTKDTNTISAPSNTIPSSNKSHDLKSNSKIKFPGHTEIALTNSEKTIQANTLNKAVQTTSNIQISGINLNQENENSSQPMGEVQNKIEQTAVAKKTDVPVKTEIERTMEDEEEQPPKKDDIEKEVQLLNNQLKEEAKEPLVDDIEDEQDSEEEDKQDLQDDSEISIGKTVVQEDKTKEGIKSNNVPISYLNMEKSNEEYISKIPQDDFPEDDDHFFSFFLTAVIIVILLYILYHNKSKFTKVILGLIVEGRQTGRRRNSRGHAYRRLDTLEQALSTNNTASPSKIIY